jgi:hypothetical protein
MREFDHIVVAARTLDEGAAWVEARLGVAPVPGGKHPTMGTHNRLLRIGPREFLEVIAIDPDAAPPARARWLGLDSPEVRGRLEREGAALMHWVERTDDIERALLDYGDTVEVLDLARGPYRWKIGVPKDGHRPAGGRLPTLIQWEGGLHPADALPDSGCRLERFTNEAGILSAAFATPSGKRMMSGRGGE